MATWPATGDTDWNTKMLAYLAIEHNTDGTHKAAALSDGGVPTLNDSESNAMLKAHVYKAQTAGFVNAYAIYSATVQIYVSSTDAGAAGGSKIADQGIGVGSQYANAMVFVPKDYYFDVATAGTPTINWTPLISGGGAPIDQD